MGLPKLNTQIATGFEKYDRHGRVIKTKESYETECAIAKKARDGKNLKDWKKNSLMQSYVITEDGQYGTIVSRAGEPLYYIVRVTTELPVELDANNISRKYFNSSDTATNTMSAHIDTLTLVDNLPKIGQVGYLPPMKFIKRPSKYVANERYWSDFVAYVMGTEIKTGSACKVISITNKGNLILESCYNGQTLIAPAEWLDFNESAFIGKHVIHDSMCQKIVKMTQQSGHVLFTLEAIMPEDNSTRVTNDARPQHMSFMPVQLQPGDNFTIAANKMEDVRRLYPQSVSSKMVHTFDSFTINGKIKTTDGTTFRVDYIDAQHLRNPWVGMCIQKGGMSRLFELFERPVNSRDRLHLFSGWWDVEANGVITPYSMTIYQAQELVDELGFGNIVLNGEQIQQDPALR